MTLVAAAFLFIFGSAGAAVVFLRYPRAHFTRAAYVFMAVGGAVFIAWAVSHVLGLGVAAMMLLLLGGTLGAIGAFRKEVRMLPPSR
ncbi:MAG: hypothetical protein M3R51_05895 [Candidatus Eremiobacteraeota bacterium]|nr:hypothetical protein [Candidatus Eremiobacteraeota bacterium]